MRAFRYDRVVFVDPCIFDSHRSSSRKDAVKVFNHIPNPHYLWQWREGGASIKDVRVI